MTVTLFCAPGSVSQRRRRARCSRSPTPTRSSARCTRSTTSHGRSIGSRRATGGEPFDVVHDHCGFTALAMADRIDTPFVHTLHGQFTPSTAAFYARHGHKAALVGDQPGAARVGTARRWRRSASIPNPIDVRAWPLRERQGRLPAVDRTDDAREGAPPRDRRRSRGGCAARAGRRDPAGPAGRSSTARSRPTSTASASASSARSAGRSSARCSPAPAALLMPIRWDEPFGMVMVEALACGTPVIAFPEGAARELVVDGETGFLVDDERAMADAIGQLPRDRRARLPSPGSPSTAMSMSSPPPTSGPTGRVALAAPSDRDRACLSAP